MRQPVSPNSTIRLTSRLTGRGRAAPSIMASCAASGTGAWHTPGKASSAAARRVMAVGLPSNDTLGQWPSGTTARTSAPPWTICTQA